MKLKGAGKMSGNSTGVAIDTKRSIAKFWIVALLSVAFTVLTALHVGVVNGPAYWSWPWRSLAPGPVYGTVLVAGVPLVIGALLAGTRPKVAVALLVLGAAALQWGGAAINGPDAPSRIRAVVESPAATSYYTHAQTLGTDWLADYPSVLAEGQHHARNKPPGPIWFYRTLLDAGVQDPALVGGVLVGVLALLSVVATFGLARALGQGPHAAVLAAALMATAPGFVLFYPEFDQMLAGLGALFVAAWLQALKRPPETWGLPAAVGFGMVLSIALLWSYALLTLGVFLGLVTLVHGFATGHWRALIVRAAMALATVAVVHGVLWVVTGYDPLATFGVALDNQRDLLTHIVRPWPITVPFDLLDLFLGMGWVLSALVLMSLVGPDRQSSQLAALSVLVVIATGLLPGESARVLLFVMPLLAVGAGAELARWPKSLHVGVVVLALLGVAATVRTMIFIAV